MKAQGRLSLGFPQAAEATMADPPLLETDSRFPSGKWVGFFLQKQLPGKHGMELLLTFSQGILTGEGRDLVGEFLIKGHYHLDDGRCFFSKHYVGRHDVAYQGYNEGKGIWGLWEIAAKANQGVRLHGGFHIWPVEMGDPTGSALREEAEIPADSGLVSV